MAAAAAQAGAHARAHVVPCLAASPVSSRLDLLRFLTGLPNPNSVPQLKGWLADNGCPMETSVEDICTRMGRTPPWMPGLNLCDDGYECQFYQKD